MSTDFIANSDNVRGRIWKTYRRESMSMHPPVDVDSFYWRPPEDYFLMVSELVPYKRIDFAVRAFSRTGRRLRIAGPARNIAACAPLAGRNVEFAGRVSRRASCATFYARARALVMPGEEDFGITPVEALASGKPVIALGRGGVLETAPPAVRLGGILYPDPEENSSSKRQ